MMRFILLAIPMALSGCGDPPTIVIEPLQVVSWTPNRGAPCVEAAATDFVASVTFSDDIESGTLTPETMYVRPEAGDAVGGSIAYDKATQTADLTLTEDLAYGARHQLVVTETVKGVDKGTLAAELVSNFETVGPGGCF